MSPFSQPPAPPPQQPLPEKPDTSRPNAVEPLGQAPFKRLDGERPRNSASSSPVKSDVPSSQILSLVEALTSAKRQIDSQGDRVKHLEDLLRQERKARESAEERARHLLDRARFLTESEDTNVEKEAFDPPSENTIAADHNQPNGYEADDERKHAGKRSPKAKFSPTLPTGPLSRDLLHDTEEIDTATSKLQDRLELMVKEMDEMKQQMERYRQRAEGAEEERDTLADMVEKIRTGEITNEYMKTGRRKSSEISTQTQTEARANGHLQPHGGQNGTVSHISSSLIDGKSPSTKEVEDLQHALKMALEPSNYRKDRLMQSAPYASMLGVVLIGMGIMTYLNGWQKIER